MEWIVIVFFGGWGSRKAFPGMNLKEIMERCILLTKKNVSSREQARTKTLRQTNG